MTDSATNGTIPAPVERSKGGQFLKGHGRIGGRKIGSRNKLSEAFLADLHKTWLKHGKKVLDRVAETAPETFLRVCATVLPKVMEVDGIMSVEHHSTVHIEARDFMEAYQRWGQAVGARPPLIEAQAEVIEDDGDADEHA
jgi:hypothetical protein